MDTLKQLQIDPKIDLNKTIIEPLKPYETVIALLLGFVVLLFGYRIKKIAFFIIWFLLGYFLVSYFMPSINQMVPQIADSSLYQALVPVGGGVLVAFLGFSVEKFCVGGIGFVLTMLATIQYFGTEMAILAVGGIVGIIVAGLAVVLMKPAIIVLTSCAGAYTMAHALFTLMPDIDQQIYYWPILVGLVLIGSIFQFVTTKNVS